MVECARGIMVLVDFITFLLGVAVLGLAIYVLATYSTFQNVVNVNTLYISLAVGGVLILVSCLGCVASQRGHKGLLCIYLFFVTLALAGQIASVVLVSQYAGHLTSQISAISGGLTDTVDKELNNAILSSYVACCIGCPAVQGCNNQKAFYNSTLGFCSSSNVLVCSPVPSCSGDPNENGCFVSNNNVVPPIQIDGGFCSLMTGFHINSTVSVVGPAVSGSCGGGDPKTYLNSVVSYFNDNIYHWFIVGFGILCAIQALNLLAAIFLLCCAADRPK